MQEMITIAHLDFSSIAFHKQQNTTNTTSYSYVQSPFYPNNGQLLLALLECLPDLSDDILPRTP
jgi:hypothetical protein